MSTQQIIESWENGVEPYNATIWQNEHMQQNAKGEWLYKVKGKPVYGKSFQHAINKYIDAFPTS